MYLNRDNLNQVCFKIILTNKTKFTSLSTLMTENQDDMKTSDSSTRAVCLFVCFCWCYWLFHGVWVCLYCTWKQHNLYFRGFCWWHTNTAAVVLYGLMWFSRMKLAACLRSVSCRNLSVWNRYITFDWQTNKRSPNKHTALLYSSAKGDDMKQDIYIPAFQRSCFVTLICILSD